MKPVLVFQTDFTYKEGAVCAMYGVVKSVDRELEIYDGTHEIPKYDIWSASYRLYQYIAFWPPRTVFVSVVDPGVGTSRRACVARTENDYFIVTPDNGSLTHVKNKFGISEIREIDEGVNRLRGKGTEGVGVFHGRDVFAYCAARLASGLINYEQVGPSYPVSEIVAFQLHEPVMSDDAVSGIFEINDPNFGNIWTNIPVALFQETGFVCGDNLNASIRHIGDIVFEGPAPFVKSFGYAKQGEVLIYNNELSNIAMAVCKGDICGRLGLGYGADWTVEFRKNKAQQG